MTPAAADGSDRGTGEPAAPKTRVPLTGHEVGHLRIKRGLSRTKIFADPNLPDLLHGRWGRQPQVVTEGGDVTLTYPRFRMKRWGTEEITLNASVPWDISIDGNVRHVKADLTLLKLRSLTIKGSAGHLVLMLGKPRDEVPIELRAADRLTIKRPAESPVRIELAGGAAKVVVDDQSYGAIGGKTVLTTGPVLRNAYHLKIYGARRLRVATL